MFKELKVNMNKGHTEWRPQNSVRFFFKKIRIYKQNSVKIET